MTCENTGDLKPGKAQERTFRNPLKKFLKSLNNSKDSACSRPFKNKVYEVPSNHSGHVAYAIDSAKKKLNATPAADPVADLLRSLPIKTFRDKMTNLLRDSDCYGSDQAREECSEDCTRRDVASAREEYIKIYDRDLMLTNGSSEPMITTLDYPLSAFRNVDMTVKTIKESLFTPGWKEVSVCKSYGPGRFYLKDSKNAKNAFEDAFAKWLENHSLADLQAFDGGTGYFIYYNPASETFKGVYSLDYGEKPTVLDLDSGEIHNVVKLEEEIRLMPDKIRDSLNPVVAARLTRDISAECYTQFLNSIAKTSKVYVTGCEDGVLLICPSARSKKLPDVSNVFCAATSCLGRCSKSRRKSEHVRPIDN